MFHVRQTAMPEDQVSQPKGQVQLTDQVNRRIDQVSLQIGQANRLIDQVRLTDRINQRRDRLHRTRHILRQTATVSHVQVQNMSDRRETTITRLQDRPTPPEATPALREAAAASTLVHAAAAWEAAVAV